MMSEMKELNRYKNIFLHSLEKISAAERQQGGKKGGAVSGLVQAVIG